MGTHVDVCAAAVVEAATVVASGGAAVVCGKVDAGAGVGDCVTSAAAMHEPTTL